MDVTVSGEGLGFVVFTDIEVKTEAMRGPCGSQGGREVYTEFFWCASGRKENNSNTQAEKLKE